MKSIIDHLFWGLLGALIGALIPICFFEGLHALGDFLILRGP